jgi:hypothetical protein
LPQLVGVAIQLGFLIHIADLSFCSFGLAHLTAAPRAVRQLLDAPQHGTAAPPDADEPDLASLQFRKVFVGGHAAVEQQFLGIRSGLLLPVIGEANRHRVHVVAEDVGRGIAHDPPAGLLGHECHHCRAGTVPHR